MENHFYKNVLIDIQKKESQLTFEPDKIINESYQMIRFLKDVLSDLKKKVIQHEFSSNREEIYFFKHIKPHALGKLIFYNKISRIETVRPVDDGTIYFVYYTELMEKLKIEFEEYLIFSEFYRYYKSGRTDKDEIYFKLGNINFQEGLNSFVFEADVQFSTYYDYKIARIIANNLLYTYLKSKIEFKINSDQFSSISSGDTIHWSNTQNALIELIYALYTSNSISHNSINIRKIASVFEDLFNFPLNDIHHAFHRMKTRTGSRTAFLDQLKISLEEYMDKDL